MADVPSAMEVEKTNRAAENERAVQTVLTHVGWKIARTVCRKTGKVSWNCRSPRVAGAAVKTFSSLVQALSYEARVAARDSATREVDDENDEYAVFAREILKKSGWVVNYGLWTGSDGQGAWLYRPPKEVTEANRWFKNWRVAIMEEYVKREPSTPSQKKRDGLPKSSSPGRRVTRKPSSPEVAEKVADGSGEDEPDSMLPALSSEDYSDVDGGEKRKLDIVIRSARKRTQKFTRSDTGTSYLETPFGSVLNFTQKENAFTLQVTTHDLPKERISVSVKKGKIVIKARYGVEQQLHNITACCRGSVSSKLTLPNDVERQKITAELKNSLLTLTLPKCLPLPPDSIKFKMQ